jgi:hypothetical protein
MQAKKNKNPIGFIAEKQHSRNSYSFFLPVTRGVMSLKYLFIRLHEEYAGGSLGEY